MPFAQGIALGRNKDGRLELVITVVDNGSSAVWHLREDDAGSPQWRLLDLPPDIGFGGPAIARVAGQAHLDLDPA